MRISKLRKSIIFAFFITTAFASCTKEHGLSEENRQIIVRDVQDNDVADGQARYDAINKSNDLRGETIGLHASRTISGSPTFFSDISADVTSTNSAIISPPRYWPVDKQGSLKIFSWYPYSGDHRPTSSFANGQMTLNYTADGDAANHVDVMAAISTPAREMPVDILFHHTLTKVSFVFRKIAPAPENVTIEKIEFQNVGKSGTLALSDLPIASTSKYGKKKFAWSGITTGTISSIPGSDNKTVTDVERSIGNTFLMLPTDIFPASAKLVLYTNVGNFDFPLTQLVAGKQHSWESGEHINYQVTYTNQDFTIKAEPMQWNSVLNNIIFDREYYLKVSETTTQLAAKAATVYIDVETNYKKSTDPDTGIRAGAFLAPYIDGNTAGPNIETGTPLTLADNWAEAVMEESEPSSDGLYKYHITLKLDSYGGSTHRWAAYYISAGNMKHRMSIQQYGGTAWLDAIVEDDPDPSASGRKRINVISGNPGWWAWEVASLSDPYDIFLNKETMLRASGGGQGYVYFYFKANAPTGKEATITFKNTNGSNAPFTATITSP